MNILVTNPSFLLLFVSSTLRRNTSPAIWNYLDSLESETPERKLCSIVSSLLKSGERKAS